jgi:hypothetical protein
MNRRQFASCSGVIVDWCKPHGAWFDRNELKQIVQFIQSGGLNKAREKEKLEIEEERQKLRDERRKVENLRAFDLAASPDSRDSDVLGFLGGIWNTLE